MNSLIVFAHPEPRSFCGALCDVARETALASGHQVTISDLYAQGFTAIAGPSDFVRLSNPAHFALMAEQDSAYESGTFTPEIMTEMERLDHADFVNFVFPLWWFSFPAVLKGWVDRVLVSGFAYGRVPAYSPGHFPSKRAMLTLTTGLDEESYRAGGASGDLNTLLHPIQHGVLQYCGLEVLRPFVAWGADEVSPERRTEYLSAYRQRLLGVEGEQPLTLCPAPALPASGC